MSNILNEVLSANQQYGAGFGDKGSLALPPACGFAILTCMDARLSAHSAQEKRDAENSLLTARDQNAATATRDDVYAMYSGSRNREPFRLAFTDLDLSLFGILMRGSPIYSRRPWQGNVTAAIVWPLFERLPRLFCLFPHA